MALPIWIVTPKQNADIVKMMSEGIISKETARQVLEWVIEQNIGLVTPAASNGEHGNWM